jgi:hypothetical protein
MGKRNGVESTIAASKSLDAWRRRLKRLCVSAPVLKGVLECGSANFRMDLQRSQGLRLARLEVELVAARMKLRMEFRV